MWYVILILLLLIVAMKMLYYKLCIMAVLLYFAECGLELPNAAKIQEYASRVVKKLLGIKAD